MAGLKTKPEYDGLAEAVSLGIALLKKSKQNSWPELVEGMGSGNLLVLKAFKAVDLTDAQLDTVNMWQSVLNLVKINPAVIPVICPACQHYVLTADTAPSRCMVTSGCEGKPFKVAAATSNAASKTPAYAKKAAPVATPATEPAPEAAPPAKAEPARRAAKQAAAAQEIEHMPDDVPEPEPVAEEPTASPVDEPAAAPQSAPVEDVEPVLDMVIVASDEDPFD